MSIYTDSGVTLFQVTPDQLTFQPSGALGAGVNRRAGAWSTARRSPAPRRRCRSSPARSPGSCNCATRSRRNIGRNSIRSPATSSAPSARPTNRRRTPACRRCPACSPIPALTGVPELGQLHRACRLDRGQSATSIPAQGGNATLLRDGGISDPSSADYTYNTTGDSGYTGRLQQLVSALQTPTSFSSSGGLGATASITDYANSFRELAARRRTSRPPSNATYQSSLLSQASSALQNATGVNLDTEMTNMLNIENSYTTSAKLLTTVTTCSCNL